MQEKDIIENCYWPFQETGHPLTTEFNFGFKFLSIADIISDNCSIMFFFRFKSRRDEPDARNASCAPIYWCWALLNAPEIPPFPPID